MILRYTITCPQAPHIFGTTDLSTDLCTINIKEAKMNCLIQCHFDTRFIVVYKATETKQQ